MRAAALCAGSGIRSRQRSRRPALRMPGRRFPRTPRAASCSCQPAAPAPTTTAARGRTTTRGPIPSWRCPPRRASAYGASSSCITTCGITTPRRSRSSRRCDAKASKSPSSSRATRRGMCSCSAATPAHRFSASKSAPSRKATSRAKQPPQRSRFRSHRHRLFSIA